MSAEQRKMAYPNGNEICFFGLSFPSAIKELRFLFLPRGVVFVSCSFPVLFHFVSRFLAQAGKRGNETLLS